MTIEPKDYNIDDLLDTIIPRAGEIEGITEELSKRVKEVAKAQLYELITKEIIGEDETPVEVWDEKEKVSLAILKSDIRNELRQEQRQKLSDLFGKEK